MPNVSRAGGYRSTDWSQQICSFLLSLVPDGNGGYNRAHLAWLSSSRPGVKVVCGKATNWLLFGTPCVRKLRQVEHVLTINIQEEAS